MAAPTVTTAAAPAAVPGQAQTAQPLLASASLYVGDLAPEVSEQTLYEVFNAVGPVNSIRVCRDSVTRKSLGYAYVNFQNVTDAERALATLNFSPVKGHSMRIMWSHRDPALRMSGTGNIFVKNLDKTIDTKALYDTFSLFGNILSCKVAVDQDGKSRGFGFVHYESEEAASNAIERVNNMQIGSKSVYVGHFQKRGEREVEESRYTNIYIKNFPNAWTEDVVQKVFGAYGDITSHVINNDNKGRKFAFVNFNDMTAARLAVEGTHRHLTTDDGVVIGPEGAPKEDEEEDKSKDDQEKIDQRIYVQRAQSKCERLAMLRNKFQQSDKATTNVVNLFVKNLHESIDDDKLREVFETFGPITSAKVMKGEGGVETPADLPGGDVSKGFGFVCFGNAEAATAAVREMHLKLHMGKPLYVGLAEQREQRRQRLIEQRRMVPHRYRSPINHMGPRGGGMPDGMAPPDAASMYRVPRGPAVGYYPTPMQRTMPPQGGQVRPSTSGMFRSVLPGGWPNSRPGAPRGYGASMHHQQQFSATPVGGQMNMRAPPYNQANGRPRPPYMAKPGQMQGKPDRPPYQYTSQARNQETAAGAAVGGNMMDAPGAQAVASSGGGAAGNVGGDAAATTGAMGVQKQMLGEQLFPRILDLQPQLAGKITGMMLEMENAELSSILQSESLLRAKVDEAMRVLSGNNETAH